MGIELVSGIDVMAILAVSLSAVISYLFQEFIIPMPFNRCNSGRVNLNQPREFSENLVTVSYLRVTSSEITF